MLRLWKKMAFAKAQTDAAAMAEIAAGATASNKRPGRIEVPCVAKAMHGQNKAITATV